MTELLLKIADFILGGLLEKWRQRNALSDQFEALKCHVLYENLMNNYPAHLANLRRFLLDSGLVQKPAFEEFFARWLADPIVAAGRPVLGLFSSEQIVELKRELSCLQP